MENKTGILLTTSDRMYGSKNGAPYTKSQCETLDSCLKRMHTYMQEVAEYHPNGLWTNESGMLVTPDDASKMTQRWYDGYTRIVCHNLVSYHFTYRTATGELLAVVTIMFNDFYKV